jgi:hypothetical protein
MRPPSWHWEYFYKGDLSNSTQHKAYCNFHTNYHLQLLEKAEKAAVDAGTVDSERSKSVLILEGP